MVLIVILGQQYTVGEKPTVILYTYINHHSGIPSKIKQKQCSTQLRRLVIIYDSSAIKPYNIIGAHSVVSSRYYTVLYC